MIICHTYGIAAPEIAKIADFCAQKKIILIEDICECMGTRCGKDEKTGEYQLAGTFGEFAIASLYANKQITAGDGGWIH